MRTSRFLVIFSFCIFASQSYCSFLSKEDLTDFEQRIEGNNIITTIIYPTIYNERIDRYMYVSAASSAIGLCRYFEKGQYIQRTIEVTNEQPLQLSGSIPLLRINRSARITHPDSTFSHPVVKSLECQIKQ